MLEEKCISSNVVVVIPCWNEEKLLPEILECLLRQTYTNWIAICVDDCSTDKTADVIQKYHNIDRRILYVLRDREPKGGQTCRNIGLEMAEGANYICFFDADDTIAPYCLEQRVAFMETHLNLDCGIFPAITYTNSIQENEGLIYGVKMFDDDLEAVLNMNLPMTGWTNIYRVTSLKKYGLKWDENVLSMQDSDYSFQLLLSGMSYDYAMNTKADYFYHIGSDGVAKQISSTKHFKSHIYLLDKVSQTISEKYGSKYDFIIECRIYLHIVMFYKSWKPYLLLLNLPWLHRRWAFKFRILIYLLTMKRGRKFIFKKYRDYTIRQNEIWKKLIAENRKSILTQI